MRIRFAAALVAATLTAGILAGRLEAHEGHDHGAPPPVSAAAAAPRAEAASDAFELVAVARDGAVTIYLDRFKTNEPVLGASIEADTPAGTASASPGPDGTYRLAAPWAVKPGRHDVVLTVTAEGATDIFPVTLEIPEAAPAGQPAASSWLAASGVTLSAWAQGPLAQAFKERLGRNDPVIVAAALGGFLLGIVMMLLVRRRRMVPALAVLAFSVVVLLGATAFAHEGEDHGDAAKPASPAATRDLAQRMPDGAVFVPKTTQRILSIRTALTEPAAYRRMIELPGRVIPDPNASGYVQASTGGRLSAPQNGFPRLGTPVRKGDILAYVTPPLQAIDVSDMRQRQGELDQQIAIVERRITRYEALSRTGAVAQVQLDEARLELQGLKERRASLDRARREAEALVAPVGGIVAEANAIAGQIAQPSAIVFHIIDPGRLWVEALSFEPVTGARNASARLGSGRSLTLTYRGSGLADRNQASPVQFAIEGDSAGLRVGQFVTVLAATEDEKTGLALPRASVIRGANGQDLVYEHSAAERFEARDVRVEPLDGQNVLVSAGIGAAKRVVTQGAELLDQVR